MGKVTVKLGCDVDQEEESVEAMATDDGTDPCNCCGHCLKNDGERC